MPIPWRMALAQCGPDGSPVPAPSLSDSLLKALPILPTLQSIFCAASSCAKTYTFPLIPLLWWEDHDGPLGPLCFLRRLCPYSREPCSCASSLLQWTFSSLVPLNYLCLSMGWVVVWGFGPHGFLLICSAAYHLFSLTVFFLVILLKRPTDDFCCLSYLLMC